jgi:Putative beta barrel porin-7 (BBP7)
MKLRIWVGALALCLSGWQTCLLAQEAAWRPVLRPNSSAPAPQVVIGATIEQPVPIMRASGADPDYAERTERPVATTAYRPSVPENSAGRLPQPGEVIAASAPAPAPAPPPTVYTSTGDTAAVATPVAGEEPISSDQFAQERSAAYSLSQSPPLSVPSLRTPGSMDVSTPTLGTPTTGTPGKGPATGNELHPPRDWQQLYPAVEPPPFPDFAPGPGPGAVDAPTTTTPTRFYVGGEYLLWWTKHDQVPPLLTTSNPGDFGFLNQPSTGVIFGGPIEHRDPQSGGRFWAGLWLDQAHTTAIEVEGFFLGQRSDNFSTSSNTFPVLARPFQIAQTGTEFSELISLPGVFNGRVSIEAPTRLWGIDTNIRCPLCPCVGCGGQQIQLLAGFRYLDLKEGLTVMEDVQGLNTPAAGAIQNSTDLVFDSFNTHNMFYGGQVGAETRWYLGRFSIDLLGKVALGVTHEEVTINGGQTVTNNTTGITTSVPGGLLALPGANIGTFSKDRFAVVPEIGLTLGYQVTNHIRASVGYNFLYWSSVVRPGDQIDRVLDPTKIPNFSPAPAGVTGPANPVRPMVTLRDTDYWAQGLTFGLEFVW